MESLDVAKPVDKSVELSQCVDSSQNIDQVTGALEMNKTSVYGAPNPLYTTSLHANPLIQVHSPNILSSNPFSIL